MLKVDFVLRQKYRSPVYCCRYYEVYKGGGSLRFSINLNSSKFLWRIHPLISWKLIIASIILLEIEKRLKIAGKGQVCFIFLYLSSPPPPRKTCQNLPSPPLTSTFDRSVAFNQQFCITTTTMRICVCMEMTGRRFALPVIDLNHIQFSFGFVVRNTFFVILLTQIFIDERESQRGWNTQNM